MKNLLMIVVTLFLITSCQKEQFKTDVQNVTFKRTEFVPSGEDQVREIVTKFVATIDHGQIGKRNAYPNTEVNEAVWTLEASGNLLKNVDMDNGTTSDVVVHSLTVNNTVENNTLKMIGSDMTTKFDQLLSDINLDETNNDATAVAIDVEIISADNNTTELEAKVVYNRDFDPIPWSLATIKITQGNQKEWSTNGCFFSPSFVVFNNPTWIFGHYCSSNTPTDCFYVGVGTATTLPIYDEALHLASDISTSYTIATELLDDYLSTSPPLPNNGQNISGYEVSRSVVTLKHQYPWNDGPNQIWQEYLGSHVLSHYVSYVVAAGVTYNCF